MSTFDKNFKELTIQDLNELIENKVRESFTIEYKQELQRSEQICAAISSLANTYGGDYYIGITEAKGEPLELKGIECDDVDALELKINNFLKHGIEPRIPRYEIKTFTLEDNKTIMLIRVYRSWTKPHRETKNQQFYSRTSNGKFPMDVHEIRNMFLGTTEFSKMYSGFKEERVLHHASQFADQPFCLLHYVPLSSFEKHFNLDLSLISKLNLIPLAGAGVNPRINLDGIFSESRYTNVNSKMQIFRNGIIEQATTRLITNNIIAAAQIERLFIENIQHQVFNYEKMGISEPFYVICSFYLQSEVLEILLPYEDTGYAYSDNKLVLPEILIDPNNVETETPKLSVGRMLKPMLDTLWNAFGLPEAKLEVEESYRPRH
ncbi:ATP-binding protein [Paenibacillus illinoisensis]|uniref:AlbA family DNA-binding domain-containing protein n=1 Tax=Paenibacillus illinoisensis TaxID=59845 RepID=UPI00301DA3D6